MPLDVTVIRTHLLVRQVTYSHATLMPPSCHPHAALMTPHIVLMPPSCCPHATLMLPSCPLMSSSCRPHPQLVEETIQALSSLDTDGNNMLEPKQVIEARVRVRMGILELKHAFDT